MQCRDLRSLGSCPIRMALRRHSPGPVLSLSPSRLQGPVTFFCYGKVEMSPLSKVEMSPRQCGKHAPFPHLALFCIASGRQGYPSAQRQATLTAPVRDATAAVLIGGNGAAGRPSSPDKGTFLLCRDTCYFFLDLLGDADIILVLKNIAQRYNPTPERREAGQPLRAAWVGKPELAQFSQDAGWRISIFFLRALVMARELTLSKPGRAWRK